MGTQKASPAQASVVAVVLQQNGGRGLAEQPMVVLDDAVVFVGIGTGLVALVLRRLLNGLAERWHFFAQANHPQNLYYQAVA